MTTAPPTAILVVEDDPAQRRALERLLGVRGFEVRSAVDGRTATEALLAGRVDVAIVDLNLPDTSGIDLIRRIRELRPSVECVMLTGQGSDQAAEEARLAGASDYFEKPIVDHSRFFQVVRRASEVHHLKRRIDELGPRAGAPQLIGSSQATTHVRGLIERMAGTSAPVLITGESGVGKEVVAEALHAESRRRGEFVRINCAALPESLIEAELFGAEEGTFTGQKGRREGLFATAANGTLFLDEIGEMPIGLQPKLLRVLQSQSFRPLGARTERELTARVIAATNQEPHKAMERGAFREDLYFRLAVLTIHIPPLRERMEDVGILARHFARKYALAESRTGIGFSDAAMDRLLSYGWPGNVRELSNVVQRAVIMHRGDLIEASDIEVGRSDAPGAPARASADPWDAWMALPLADAKAEATAAFTRRYLERKLADTNGNISRAAALAGMQRPNFKREMRKLGVGVAGDEDAD